MPAKNAATKDARTIVITILNAPAAISRDNQEAFINDRSPRMAPADSNRRRHASQRDQELRGSDCSTEQSSPGRPAMVNCLEGDSARQHLFRCALPMGWS
jgi:hypothetical protein